MSTPRKEPLSNVGMVCGPCAEDRLKPGKFIGQDPATFIGKYVKLGFPAKNPATGADTTEHMWVKVDGKYEGEENEELIGTLNNDPILICEYQCGSQVAFKVAEIEMLDMNQYTKRAP